MPKFQGTVLSEQGVQFAVVVVKKHIVDNHAAARNAIQSFQSVFPNIPVVLMAQDSRGIPTYYGRPDLARFLARVPLRAIPWREYTIA